MRNRPPQPASELAETFLARQLHVAGLGQYEQLTNFREACGIAEATIDTMTREGPIIAVTDIGSEVAGSDREHFVTARTPFFRHQSGIFVATAKEFIAEVGEVYHAEVKDGLEAFELLFRVGGEIGVPYARLEARGGKTINHALGDVIVHARGYNAEADREVISFLSTVHTGVHRTIALRRRAGQSLK